MLDGIEGFRDVDGDSRCTERRFRSIETRGDAGDGRKEGSRGGVLGAETMLRGRDRERGREKRKETAFEEFRGRTKKRDRAVGGGNRRWFSLASGPEVSAPASR